MAFRFLTCFCCLFLAACRVEVYEPFDDDAAGRLVPEVGGFFNITSATLKHGSAANSIVPPWKIALSGYGGIHRRVLPPDLASLGGAGAYQAVYSSVDIEPRIKVLLWDGTDSIGVSRTFLLVSVDVVGVTPDFVQAIVERAQVVLANPNLNWSNVSVVASHTHSGPAGLSRDVLLQAFAGDTASEDYISFVLDVFEKTLTSARSHASPVTGVSVQEGSFEDLSVDRLSSVTRDKKNSLYEIQTQQGKSCFDIFALHPTFHSQKDLVLSADLAGSIENSLQSSGGYSTCLFLPGAIGNASNAATEQEGISGFGQRFASRVRGGSSTALGVSRFEFGGTPVSFSEMSLNWKGCGASYAKYFLSLPILSTRTRRAWVGWMQIENDAFVFFPGEPLSDLSALSEQEMQKANPSLRSVRTVGVANGYLGYLMQQGPYEEKSLESCSALLKPGDAESLVLQSVAAISAFTHSQEGVVP